MVIRLMKGKNVHWKALWFIEQQHSSEKKVALYYMIKNFSLLVSTEAYSKPCQTSNLKFLARIVYH